MVKPKYKGRSTINPSKASTNPGTGGGARGGWGLEEAWREGHRVALLGVTSSRVAFGDEKGEDDYLFIGPEEGSVLHACQG